jgi:hypothetical protein
MARDRVLIAPLLTVAVLAFGAAANDAQARQVAGVTAASEISKPVHRVRTFRVAPGASYLALHWRGARRARVRIALGWRAGVFGRRTRVVLDEVGRQRRGNETYGSLIAARRARAVRVWSDRPLRRLTVLALRDRGRPRTLRAAPAMPAVVPRAGWGADESLRFDSRGAEIWPPAFWPVQKLVVHHTAGRNGDPDPAATIRSIYYYHAVTQGWGDIGYNFLVDESGNVYEGRHARTYAPGEAPTGENEAGLGVTAAHAEGFNSGTVGVALLGTLTRTQPTTAARDALERFMAWKSARHGIDPLGSALYTNPVNGTRATFPNIAGHRDVGATECPGDAFYSSLPAVRSAVNARVNAAAAYARPLSATPLRVALVPAYERCVDGDARHGPPLAFPSCTSPRPTSSRLTVGTPDANGKLAQSVGAVVLRTRVGDPATTADEADVALDASLTDVRNASSLSDYAGALELGLDMRITDRQSGTSGADPATVEDVALSIAVPCAATPDSADGAACRVTTSLDAVVPGSVREGARAIWELERISASDGGDDGSAATHDGSLFATQGLFVP